MPSSSPSADASSPPAASSPPSAGDPSPSLAIATIAIPSPTLALPAPNPNSNSSNSAAAPGSRRGLPPPCWTNEETLALIDSYKEKWYALRRGNLRAAHWEEVAGAVAARSLHLPASTPKTAVQCRHKIEKLRKRYRSERQRSLNHDPTAQPQSQWIFFKKMEQMENPNPNPNPNPSQIPPPHQNHQYRRYQESDEEEEEEDEIEPQFHRRPQNVANGSGGGGGSGGLKFTIPRAVRTSRAVPMGNLSPNSSYNPKPNFSKGFAPPGFEEMRSRLKAKRQREEEEEEDKSSGTIGEMVRALKMLGQGYMRMEQTKMDMAREMERTRMEMELKRTEMILDMQRRIVDSFVRGVAGEKKAKRWPDS